LVLGFLIRNEKGFNADEELLMVGQFVKPLERISHGY
jgi:hypothetical protein